MLNNLGGQAKPSKTRANPVNCLYCLFIQYDLPMAKDKTLYTCTDCGATSPKWLGKCQSCNAWNTLIESVAESNNGVSKNRYAGMAALAPASEVAVLSDIEAQDVARTPTGQEELDRVLGGGMVEGGVVLIGGDPGIGKSTLLLQALDGLQRSGLSTLYVTGEESGAQVALRSRRLGLDHSQVQVLAETQLEKVLATIDKLQPAIVVMDSIQTVYSDQLTSAPGSVAQVRECAAHLTRMAKSSGTAVVLVGHVTKEGALAGPRVLEHMVDTVLYFEGDTHSPYRLVRAIKNRFGAVNEIGVFAMTEKGLKGVSNPSAIFLSQHSQPVPGSSKIRARPPSLVSSNRPSVLISRRPTVTTRGISLGSASNTVGRPSGSIVVVTRPRILWNSHRRVRSRSGNGVPSTVTTSRLPTITAGLSSTLPLTATRPSVIQLSTSRREPSPARAMTLATRSGLVLCSIAAARSRSCFASGAEAVARSALSSAALVPVSFLVFMVAW